MLVILSRMEIPPGNKEGVVRRERKREKMKRKEEDLPIQVIEVRWQYVPRRSAIREICVANSRAGARIIAYKKIEKRRGEGKRRIGNEKRKEKKRRIRKINLAFLLIQIQLRNGSNQKSSCFSSSGLGLNNNISTIHDGFNALLLNGGWFFETIGIYSSE